MTIRKHQVFESTLAITLSSDETIPKGTTFVCLRGGQKPQMAYLCGKEVNCIAGGAASFQHKMKEVDKGKVPPLLAKELGLDTPHTPVAAFRKGDFVTCPETIKISNGEDIPAGTLMRCERGGKTPTLDLLDSDGDVYSIRPSGAIARILEPASPVEEHPVIREIANHLRTYPGMSQETLAMNGHLTFRGKRVTVSNQGHGDPNFIDEMDKGAHRQLGDALDSVLADAGIHSQRKYRDSVSDYVDFINSSAGLERFTDYMFRLEEFLKDVG